MKTTLQSTRVILVLFLIYCTSQADTFIRVNQLGFLPADSKSAIVISDLDISEREFVVKNSSGKVSERGLIGFSKGAYGKFQYVYEIDFSMLRAPGKYFIEIAGLKSSEFSIGARIYNNLTDSLLSFFKVQRCGYTSPEMHDICHIADATALYKNGVLTNIQYDVTGGWHDAGDYTKFLNTTAFTTYMLLFAYEFDQQKFGFDNNKNNVPDILEEAKIGLDWLIRAAYENKFITQVQDEDDQNVGWRLPEDDPLQFDRPAFVGNGKNLIGIFVATMSIASRIWKEKMNYFEFANKCLTLAENYFSYRNFAPDVAEEGTGAYVDQSYEGKLALGAVELYQTTKRNGLLSEAMKYADQAKSDYWWSWGDINALAHYRLAEYDEKYVGYLKKNLEHFSNESDSTVFDRGVEVSWGTNHAILGVTLQNILYSKVSGDRSFSTIALEQRDYILGRNPWGVSFISNIGETHTEYFHHQVAYFNGGKITGALAAGPIRKSILDERNIKFEKIDRFANFQTEDVVYIDDRMDYISNEPTISSNATAVFVMGYFSKR